jgi:hypothetical protein
MTPMAVDVFPAGPGGRRPAPPPSPAPSQPLSSPTPDCEQRRVEIDDAINFSPNYDSLRIEFIAKISYLSESEIAGVNNLQRVDHRVPRRGIATTLLQLSWTSQIRHRYRTGPNSSEIQDRHHRYPAGIFLSIAKALHFTQRAVISLFYTECAASQREEIEACPEESFELHWPMITHSWWQPCETASSARLALSLRANARMAAS